MMWDLWWDTEEIFAMILEQADKFPKTFLDRVSSKPRLSDKTLEAFGIENANVGWPDLIPRACDRTYTRIIVILGSVYRKLEMSLESLLKHCGEPVSYAKILTI